MTGMMLYLSLGLMVLTVLSNRYWRRQVIAARQSQIKVREKVDDVARELSDAAAEYGDLARHVGEAEQRTVKVEQQMQIALLELDKAKEAPVSRYYVFDRVEPRPGRFWEAAVRHLPTSYTTAADRQGQRAWIGIRRYIVLAETEREVRDRVSARFPRRSGYELVEVIPCQLSGLTVNRIAELSTFRHPKKDGEEESPRPKRRAAAQS